MIPFPEVKLPEVKMVNGKVIYTGFEVTLNNVPKDFPFEMLNYYGAYIRPYVMDHNTPKDKDDGYIWVMSIDDNSVFRMWEHKPCRLLVPDIMFEGIGELL
jgi:hypothetical protein